MGQSNHQGQNYSELSFAKLELEYLRVEPFVTIYGEGEEIKKLEAKLEKGTRQLQTIVNGLATENMTLKQDIRNLEGKVEKIDGWFNKLSEKMGLSRDDIIEMLTVTWLEEKKSLDKQNNIPEK